MLGRLDIKSGIFSNVFSYVLSVTLLYDEDEPSIVHNSYLILDPGFTSGGP